MAMHSLLRYECKGSNSKLNPKEQIQKKKRIEHRLEGRVFGSRKEQAIFFSLQKGKTGSGASQNIIQWVPAQIRSRLKRSGREADYSPQSRTNMPL
jgi:hypothetical protein